MAFMRRGACLLALLLLGASPRAAEVVDDAGRKVTVPERAARVLPAGPPAAVLLYAVAPSAMLGWPMAPPFAGAVRVPRVTGAADAAAVAALRPDLIVDFGAVDARYAAIADAIQAQTGIPTLLFDGSLDRSAAAIRRLAALTGGDGEALARAVEAALAAFPPRPDGPRVVYARGPGPFEVLAPHSVNAEALKRFGATVLAPLGEGTWRRADAAAVRALEPDLVLLADARGMPDLAGLRVAIVPATPFGWVEGPPSVNRLIGLAWLSAVLEGRDSGAAEDHHAAVWRALLQRAPP